MKDIFTILAATVVSLLPQPLRRSHGFDEPIYLVRGAMLSGVLEFVFFSLVYVVLQFFWIAIVILRKSPGATTAVNEASTVPA